MTRMPTIYLPHGGGPCFFMDWTMGPADTWDEMAQALRELGKSIEPKPKAIILVSAHWEESNFTVLTAENPKLLFDYYGFPEHTYRLEYPAPNSAEIVAATISALNEAGIKTDTNAERGYDHGVFIPLKVVYPDADIPIVQLSLRKGLDAKQHLAVGAALSKLRDEGVLIIGSGMSYHNLRNFLSGEGSADSFNFDKWLTSAACESDPSRRNKLLCEWSQAPSARLSHPREEHLLPLMVAAGAAGTDVGQLFYSGTVMNSKVSGYRFG